MAWAARGAVYFALGRTGEAIGDLDHALKLRPDDSEADKLLAQARAVEALARKPATAVRVEPAAPPPPEPIPAGLRPAPTAAKAELPQLPEPKEAKRDFAAAALHNQRGRELTKLGHYREAVMELNAAITADPMFALAYNARGFAYYMLRDYPSAVADFDKAIELMPSYKNAIDNRAAARKAAGLKER